MAEFNLSVDLAGIAEAQAVVNAKVFPLLNQAVRAVAQQTASNWMAAVMRAKLWKGEKDAYVETITWKMTGDFSAVVWTDYKYAEDIENGRPARDLKKMLDTSFKVRLSKKGMRYLIIPFRHNTPGSDAVGTAMPPSVYAMASALAPSKVIGMTRRVSGTGAFNMKTKKPMTVPQRKYSWGGSLVAKSLGGDAGMKRYANMYKFDTSSPKAKSSAYLTFRVMTENSRGWIVPPQAGQHIALGVVQAMQPLAEKVFAEAVRSMR